MPRAAMAMTAPDALWLNGSLYGAGNWELPNSIHPVRLTKDGDKFTARNVRLHDASSFLHFLGPTNKYYNPNDVELTDGSSVKMAYGSGANFFLQAGTYDITVSIFAPKRLHKKL